KLLGFDYEIVFKKGVDNVAADALSRVNQGAELLQTIVSSMSSDVMDQIKASCQNDDTMQQLIKSLKDNSYKGNKLSLEGDLLKRKGKIMVDNKVELMKQLIAYFHESAVGGHSGGKTVIMVVVDRLSKYAHFMPLAHPFNASQVAQVFLDDVYKLHGLPESIVSDRDK
ncbi:reverse transcriptase, partial [Tanacetum coccineum]